MATRICGSPTAAAGTAKEELLQGWPREGVPYTTGTLALCGNILIHVATLPVYSETSGTYADVC